MQFDVVGFIFNSLVLLFFTMTLGNLFGDIKFRKFNFGITGTLFIGLFVGYFLTKYIDESAEEGKEVPVKEETVRLKLINGTFLVEDVSKNDGNLAYAYDTKLKKVVFINPYNKFKIMLIAN